MKILLTGKPKSGKTTLLQTVISRIRNKQGFVTKEVQADGDRTGFELISAHDAHMVIASVDSKSDIRVSKYGIDVAGLDSFIGALPAARPDDLLYIDEIGEMQLYSDTFKQLVLNYLDMPNLYLGTISSVYKDPFIDDILSREDVILLEVTEDSRTPIADILNGFVSSVEILNSLDEAQHLKVTTIAKQHAHEGEYLQLKKLFKNAVRYLAEGRILSVSSGEYQVEGNHGLYTVSIKDQNYICTCKLFYGEGEYKAKAGECSHIQAVKLLVTNLL